MALLRVGHVSVVDGGLPARPARAEALALVARAQSSIQASNQQIARARALIDQSSRLLLGQPTDTSATAAADDAPSDATSH